MELPEIYADAAGETHYRTTTVAFGSRDFSPPSPPVGVSPDMGPKAAFFLTAPPGWDQTFHATPRKQLAVVVSGVITVAATDGEVRRFAPGGCFILNDTNSKGHLTQVQGAENVVALMIPLE